MSHRLCPHSQLLVELFFCPQQSGDCRPIVAAIKGMSLFSNTRKSISENAGASAEKLSILLGRVLKAAEREGQPNAIYSDDVAREEQHPISPKKYKSVRLMIDKLR